MAVFNSSVVITDAQLVDTPQLEPAFEHMLRNSSVHESVISILRANSIVDRDDICQHVRLRVFPQGRGS